MRIRTLILAFAAALPLAAAAAPATAAPVDNYRQNGVPILVPSVQKLQMASGKFAIPAEFTVACPDEEKTIVELLAAALRRHPSVKVVPAAAARAKCVFELTSEGTPEHEQGYTLSVTPEGVRVRARAGAGLFYGAQTLSNLIRNAAAPELDCLAIRDWPDFNRRGWFLTIRVMKPSLLPTFKQTLEAMASLKLNWLLLEIGECFPYRDNPFTSRDLAFTREQLTDLMEFCRSRHIEITPTLQIWSHTLWMTTSPKWNKMTEGKPPRGRWYHQICPHSDTAREISAMAIREQIEFFRPKVFGLSLDELYLGPYGKCPVCKADPDLTATNVKLLKFFDDLVLKHGARPMVCQDSFTDHRWAYGTAMRRALSPQELVLWWDYNDRLCSFTMSLFRDRQLVGHSLHGKPFNTQNMLRAVRQHGGRDSTLTYWYYSQTGRIIDPKQETPDGLGGFANGMDYMWHYRETPYWQLPYDGTHEMVRRLRPEKFADPRTKQWVPVPIENAVNDELGGTGRFPRLDDKSLAELTRILAATPEKYRLLTAPGGKYYAMALTGGPGNTEGRAAIRFRTGDRAAKSVALLMTASRPTVDAREYIAPIYGKKRYTYDPGMRVDFGYADGTEKKVYLRYRNEFTDWNRPFGGFNTRFVVRGTDTEESHYRFCSVEVPNPRPEAKLTSLTITALRLDGIAPAVLAVSLQNDGKPFAPVAFNPEEVAKRMSAFHGEKAAPAAPDHKITWLKDFNDGMGKATIGTSSLLRGKVKGEVVDDPTSPGKGKVLKISVPAAAADFSKRRDDFLRIDVDFPCRLDPGTKTLIVESKMPNGDGFSHSNIYLSGPQNRYKAVGCRIGTQWMTFPALIEKYGSASEASLTNLGETRMFRLTFFFVGNSEPMEFYVGRIGASNEAILTGSDHPVWRIGTESDPI